MASWIAARGAKFCLVADPKQLATSTNPGSVKLDYKNYSFVPLTAAVMKLFSSDPAVAAATFTPTPPLQIAISRRPNKRSASTPAAGSKPIGAWSAVSQGFATLNADVDLHNQAQRIAAVTAWDDVQVT
jgi:hypothetical protein